MLQALVVSMRLQVQYGSNLDIERSCRDALKSEVIDFFSELNKVKGLHCTSCTKKRMATAEIKALESQRQRLAGH